MANFLYNLSVFLILVVLMHTKAQDLKDGHCRNVKPARNFDPDRFTSLWYLFARTAMDGAPAFSSNCTMFQHSPPDDDIWPLTHYWVDSDDKKYKHATNSRITGIGVGKTGPSNSDYTYLATDYRTYAAVYTCKNQDNNKHNETLWVLTKEKKPNSDTLAYAINAFHNNKLPYNELKIVDQSGCPDNWDDAEEV